MKNRSIMIIGAGLNQINLIRSARESGYQTIVIDPNEKAPGRTFADVFYSLGPTDFEAHCAVIERHSIEGIVSTQMDRPLLFMARVAEYFGFKFITQESACWARDKFKMKERFIQGGVPCAKGVLLKGKNEDVISAISPLSFPLIMKPLDAFSSRGVYTIYSPEEISGRFDITSGFSSDGSVLVEEFIGGRMISVEGFVYKNEAHIIQYTERYKFTPEPLRVELGHIQPALLTDAEKEEVDDTIHKTIKALKINDCGFHAELKINDRGPFMIEIGARLGGDFNASHLVPLSTGINIEKVIANIAMGDEPSLPERKEQFAMIKWVELKEGEKIKNLPSLGEIREKYPPVVETHIFLRPDSVVPKVTDSSKRAGFIIVTGNSRESVIRDALEVEQLIQAGVEYYT